MDLAIIGGKVLTTKGLIEANVGVEGGRVVRLTKRTLRAEEVFDAKGLLVMPGIVDAHVHLREPGRGSEAEDWKSGTKAAAAGGVTTLLDMPNNRPPITTPERLEEKRRVAREKSLVDFGFHFAASKKLTEVLEEVRGVASVKFYLSGRLAVGFDTVLRTFPFLEKKGLVATFHAETEELIGFGPLAALDAVSRVSLLSSLFRVRVHVCHLSSRTEVEIASKRNLSAEVTPHHLFLGPKLRKRLGRLAEVRPPLPSEGERRGLLRALREGLIDTIASDHAPWPLEAKEEGAPGFPGLETTLPLMLTYRKRLGIGFGKLVELLSKKPSSIFGLERKGEIKVGFWADFAVVDHKLEKEVRGEELHTRCGWSPYEGLKLRGWPVATFVRGKLVYNHGDFDESFCGKEVSYVPREVRGAG